MDTAYTLISLLNGLSVGLLLFMLASGLTLIFSMMGVLNFAHASFYLSLIHISEWRKADAKHPYSVENTGYNFQMVKEIPEYVASTPTSCAMKRP